VLSFNAERFDTARLHNESGGELTAPIAGVYLISASVLWETNPNGARYLTIEVGRPIAATTSPAGETGQTVTTIARLSAGDVARAFVSQDSGVSLTVHASPLNNPPMNGSEFSMVWIAPG